MFRLCFNFVFHLLFLLSFVIVTETQLDVPWAPLGRAQGLRWFWTMTQEEPVQCSDDFAMYHFSL